MILFLSHPVKAPTREGVRENIDSTLALVRFLVRHTHHAICAPWLPYVLALDDSDPHDRERGISDSIAMLSTCGGLVLGGPAGACSDGLTREWNSFTTDTNRIGRPVCDLRGMVAITTEADLRYWLGVIEASVGGVKAGAPL